MEESRYIDYTFSGNSDRIYTQGSRRLVSPLTPHTPRSSTSAWALGHTLELRADTRFTGAIYRLILNISLTAPDSLDSRTNKTTRTMSAP